MFGSSILKPLFTNLIATKVVNRVYHSVIIRTDQSSKKPSAPVGNRYVFVGPDDQQGFYAYCRQIGNLENASEERLGSCSGWAYKTTALHRLVFFHANESRPHEDISAILLKSVMSSGPGIKFQRMISIPETIVGQEVPDGRFTFGTSTYYTAIEFLVFLKLQTDNCEQEIICEGVPNPFC
jgi:hypothetical protein